MSCREHSIVARVGLVAALVFGSLSSGCYAPTLSKPRGAAHLDALAEASAHQHHGRYREAADAYQRAADAAERRVDRDEMLYRATRSLARLGARDEAIAICDKLGSDAPLGRRTLRARLDAARYRLDAGETERAREDLRALIIAQPESAAASSALRMLVRLDVDAIEDKQQGLVWVRDLRSEIKQSSLGEALMSLEAALLLELGRKDEAKLTLERQVERYPYPEGSRWDDALWQLADLSLEAESPKEAVRYLRQMIAVHESSFILGSYTRPLMSKAALRIARIYRDDLRDPKAALDAYAEVRSEFPRSLVIDDALAEEADLRITQGDRKHGCKLLEQLVEQHQVGSARRRAEARIAAECRR
ncbi:MAG: tetratricopeptide repeat protein [Polyangiales bacterium]